MYGKLIVERENNMRNIMLPWVRGEYKNIVIIVIMQFLFGMGILLDVEMSSGGTSLGLSGIRNESALERFVEGAEGEGRLYPDMIVNSGYSIGLTEREDKEISYSVGGVSVDIPAMGLFSSEYDRNYNLFWAPLGRDMVCVLIQSDSNSVYRYKDISGMEAVDVKSDSISGSARLVAELKGAVPELAAYENIYVLKGYRAEKHIFMFEIVAAGLFLFIALWQMAIRIPFLQKFSRTGRRIQELARNVGMSYKDLMECIRREIQQAVYRNGNQYLTGRYLILNASYNGDESKGVDIIPVEAVKQIKILESDYDEDMNELRIQGNGRSYSLTVHKNRQETEAILDEILAYARM